MTDIASHGVAAEATGDGPKRVLSTVAAQRAGARGRWWRDARRRRMLALADVLSATVATAAVLLPAAGTPWCFALLPVWPLVAKLIGLYDRDHRTLRHLTADEVPGILCWTAVCTALAVVLLTAAPGESVGWMAALAMFAAASILAIGARAAARWLWWQLTPPERLAVIGSGEVLASVHRKRAMLRAMHFEVVSEQRIEALGEGAVRAATLRDLSAEADRIVVASDAIEAELIGELKGLCRRSQAKLSAVAPLRGRAMPAGRHARLADLPIVEYNTWDQSRSTILIKRLVDVTVAALGLILLAPALIAIAIAIKLDSRGPVIFSQIRAGLDGRPFRMYKLRTMYVDAEARLDLLVDLDALDEPVFKLRDDPRVTRAGRWLRRFSIDEIPQLLNVLAGEMSIVGPRPEQVELVARYRSEARRKLAAKPGLTGPMQISGRGELTFSERLTIEIEYVENPTLARDLRIVLHTLPAVIRGTGAF